MTWGNWWVCGFAATVVLTILMAGSQSLGLTRMNIPYLLGTMFTPDRDRARVVGIIVHLLNGWGFSLLYVLIFQAWGGASVWRGVLTGLTHAAFFLVVGMPALPGLHPRMVSEQHAGIHVRQLEPPGFLGLNYGARTPVSVAVSHVVFGAILGAFVRV